MRQDIKDVSGIGIYHRQSVDSVLY